MEITKTRDELGSNIVVLTEDTKKLTMYMAGNGDLYMEMTDGIRLNKDLNDWRYLDIFKNPKLQDINNSIVWVSDDGLEKEEDRLIINDYGEIYRLSFIRNNPIEKTKRKPSRSIVIRFATSGSRYSDSVPSVIDMYHKLIEIAKKPKEKIR